MAGWAPEFVQTFCGTEFFARVGLEARLPWSPTGVQSLCRPPYPARVPRFFLLRSLEARH
jgi:hypothetical protein